MPEAIMNGLPWLQLGVVLTMAVLLKEYLDLRHLLQDARLSGICDNCPEDRRPSTPLHGKLEKVQQQEQEVIQQKSQGAAELILREGSAVWCQGTDYSNRLCRFRNLCYLPEPAVYVFFHHASNTVLSGIPEDRHSPALADLSTVQHHNRQLFNYVDVPAETAHKVLGKYRPAVLVNHTSLLMKRFNPDNLMHVLHDDLLPLYYTLMMHGLNHGASFDLQLVLMEGWEPGPYVELYQLFTTYKPLFFKEIVKANHPICFQDIYVGLSKLTTWYQYGFHGPQGPIFESPVTSVEIRQFTEYVKRRYAIQTEKPNSLKTSPSDVNNIVIFTRRYNRLILNEVDLTTALAQRLQMKVITLSMETHSIEHIIGVLAKTTVLISMHGSLLSLAMFLPPGAILLELFPYGINPSHYTPYKTLAQLPGMGILHRAWRNTRVENTVTHPERPWDTGGIAHLPREEQQRIIASTEVHTHLCCRDPEWLFRIYQDTVVDIDEIVVLIKTQLLERDIKMSAMIEEQHALVCDRISPSWVESLTCVTASDTEAKLHVRWDTPWNLEFLDGETVEYEIWLQQSGHTDYAAYMMTKTEHVFDSGLMKGVEYYVWVRCLLDSNIVGPFNTEQVVCVP